MIAKWQPNRNQTVLSQNFCDIGSWLHRTTLTILARKRRQQYIVGAIELPPNSSYDLRMIRSVHLSNRFNRTYKLYNIATVAAFASNEYNEETAGTMETTATMDTL